VLAQPETPEDALPAAIRDEAGVLPSTAASR
jgi:hypothetical protein